MFGQENRKHEACAIWLLRLHASDSSGSSFSFTQVCKIEKEIRTLFESESPNTTGPSFWVYDVSSWWSVILNKPSQVPWSLSFYQSSSWLAHLEWCKQVSFSVACVKDSIKFLSCNNYWLNFITSVSSHPDLYNDFIYQLGEQFYQLDVINAPATRTKR